MNPLLRAARCRTFVVHTLWFVSGLWLAFTGRVNAQLIYADSFDYSDGQIDSVPGSPWVMNYPATNNMSVISGRLLLTASNQESVRVNFPSTYNSGVLYSRMTVNFSQLPSMTGNFFACFRVGNLDNLRARIWANTAGAVVGKYQLGLTAISTPPYMIPKDLYLGTNYTVVCRYVVSNSFCTLWIDPSDENDTRARVDSVVDEGQWTIGHYAFVQTRPGQIGLGNDIGTLTVDDLRIGRTFAEVMPLSKITTITNTPGTGVRLQAIGQATSNYVFQATTDLASGNWVNLSTNAADTNGNFNILDPNATNFSSRFYRLLKQ